MHLIPDLEDLQEQLSKATIKEMKSLLKWIKSNPEYQFLSILSEDAVKTELRSREFKRKLKKILK